MWISNYPITIYLRELDMWISNYPITIYLRECLFSNQYSWLPCHILGDCIFRFISALFILLHQFIALGYSFPSFETVRCSMSGSNCCFLTFIQVSQEVDKLVWYSHLFKNFPVCCDPHSQRLLCCQWNRSRCFSGILLPFLQSSGC